MSKTDTADDGDDAQTETETYNAFGRHGRIVEDPTYLVSLEETGEKYGTHRLDMQPREVAEWLYMAVKGVSYGDVRERVDEDAPIILVETPNETFRVNAATGERVSN